MAGSLSSFLPCVYGGLSLGPILSLLSYDHLQLPSAGLFTAQTCFTLCFVIVNTTVERIDNYQREELVLQKKKKEKRIFPTLKKGNTIMMDGVRSLYDYKIGSLKRQQLNEGIITLTKTDIILIIIFIILILSLQMLVDMSAKMQVLENLLKQVIEIFRTRQRILKEN